MTFVFDPTVSPACTCVWLDGLRHNSPTCYEHGDYPELEAPAELQVTECHEVTGEADASPYPWRNGQRRFA